VTFFMGLTLFAWWWRARWQQPHGVVVLLMATAGVLPFVGILGAVMVALAVTAAMLVIEKVTTASEPPPSRLAAVGVAATVGVGVMILATLAPFGSPYHADVSAVYAQRAAAAPLGSDYLGRSVLARALEAHQMTLALALFASGVAAVGLRYGWSWLGRGMVLLPALWVGIGVSGVTLHPAALGGLLALTLLVMMFNWEGGALSLGGLFLMVAYGILILTALSALSPAVLGEVPLTGSIYAQAPELVQLTRLTGDSRGIVMLGGWALLTMLILWPLLLVHPPHAAARAVGSSSILAELTSLLRAR
jgi:hypothetical protein